MGQQHEDLRFDVALSYCKANAWVARDLHNILAHRGFSVYCYDYQADYAHGRLRSELRDIYLDSSLNAIIWSAAYREQPRDSLVAMERRCISNRHVEKGDDKSLAILLIDETPLGRDLDEILGHELSQFGVFGFAKFLIERLEGIRSQYQQVGDVFHPLGTTKMREELHSCTFRINPSFESDPLSRWEKLADVLVNCPTARGDSHVYLIPSGGCSPLLRHSAMLKKDSKWLGRKRRFTSAFAESRMGRDLVGYWFLMRVKHPVFKKVATVYCADYDKFLNTCLEEQRG